jgi:hypothetical protein
MVYKGKHKRSMLTTSMSCRRISTKGHEYNIGEGITGSFSSLRPFFTGRCMYIVVTLYSAFTD